MPWATTGKNPTFPLPRESVRYVLEMYYDKIRQMSLFQKMHSIARG